MATIILGYFVCVIICFGFLFAYWQDEYPDLAQAECRNDLFTSFYQSLFISIFGPIGVTMCFATTGFGKYGWRLWKKKEE